MIKKISMDITNLETQSITVTGIPKWDKFKKTLVLIKAEVKGACELNLADKITTYSQSEIDFVSAVFRDNKNDMDSVSIIPPGKIKFCKSGVFRVVLIMNSPK